MRPSELFYSGTLEGKPPRSLAHAHGPLGYVKSVTYILSAIRTPLDLGVVIIWSVEPQRWRREQQSRVKELASHRSVEDYQSEMGRRA